MSNCIIFAGGLITYEGQAIFNRNVGPYRIASSLQDAGYSVFVLDFCEAFDSTEIINVLKQHVNNETLWVGFSSTFYWPKFSDRLENNSIPMTEDSWKKDALKEMYFNSDHSEIYKIINFIRENSNAKIIYGGAKAPYYSMFQIDIENIDYYVTGNADTSIIDITNYLAGRKDKIEHLDNKTVHSNSYTEPNIQNNIGTYWYRKDFNILPHEGLPIELARGCIFKCKFCSFTHIGKKKGTYIRDTEQIKDELLKMYEVHGTESYLFTDDTFNDDNDKLEDLHKVFTSLPFKPKFSSYLRIDLMNRFPHQIDLLTEMGIVGAFFGIETLEPDSAKAIGKGLHPNKVKDCLYKIHEKWKNKTNIESGFILGLPYDTLSYFYELTNWCLEKDNPIQAIRFYPLRLFNHINPKENRIDVSEFSLNPDIYGYKFDESTVFSNWTLPTQKLTYSVCDDIANSLTRLTENRNMYGSFSVVQAMNCGIPLEDILSMTAIDIGKKYNVPELKKQKINEYKKLIGL
jgi:radical SAM superfamily enzyme YgiQ (UPF0313 family)